MPVIRLRIIKAAYSLLALSITAVMACAQEAAQPQRLDDLKAIPFRLTARVVDVDGNPISGALVKIELFNRKEIEERKLFEGLSDQHGLYSAESPCHSSDTRIEVTKDGYYMSRANYHGPAYDYRDALKSGRFEPWDPTVDVVLKKIGKPIPMYAKKGDDTEINIPGFNRDYGFDVLSWDWLPPHGRGKVADWMVYAVEVPQEKGDPVIQVTVRFVNEHDGLMPIEQYHGIESVYFTPREAPIDGYKVKWVDIGRIGITGMDGGDSSAKPVGFYLRLRSKMSSDGKLLSCHYGKIVWDDPISSRSLFGAWGPNPERHVPRTLPGIGMSAIYINPTPLDRNLEHEINKSLYQQRMRK